jgi:hypothetical protein
MLGHPRTAAEELNAGMPSRRRAAVQVSSTID